MSDGIKKPGKDITAGYLLGLPSIYNTELLEKKIKNHPKGKEWERYRYCKEMADFWAVQLGHAYTNLPVEGLRAKGGIWAKKLFGKDIAYWAGHVVTLSPRLSTKLGKGIKR